MGCGASKTDSLDGALGDPEIRVSGHAVPTTTDTSPQGDPAGVGTTTVSAVDCSTVDDAVSSASVVAANDGTSATDLTPADSTPSDDAPSSSEQEPAVTFESTAGATQDGGESGPLHADQLGEPPNKPRGQLRTLRKASAHEDRDPMPQQDPPIEVTAPLSPNTVVAIDKEREQAVSAATDAARLASLKQHSAELHKTENNADELKSFLSVGGVETPAQALVDYLPAEATVPQTSPPVGR